MRIALLLLLAAVMGGTGCAAPKPPPRMPWVTQTRDSCRVTADLLDGLAKDLKRLDASWKKELRLVKGTKGRMRYYNPGLFTRLSKQLAGFDGTLRKLKTQLASGARGMHFQYMARASEMIARLHRMLGLLAQAKTQLELAVSRERRFADHLVKRKRGVPNPIKQKRPLFGMLIRSPTGVVFTGEMGAPVKRKGGRCVGTTVAEATGYRLSDGNCYYFTAKPQPGNCPRANNTLRVFHNSDAKLFGAVKCIGMQDVFFDTYVHQLHQLRWILRRVKGLDLAGLATAFRQAVPTPKPKPKPKQNAMPVDGFQSKRACWSVSRVLRDLDQALQLFRNDLENELEKTKRGRAPLKAYNERLFTVLLATSKSLDLAQPPLQKRLAREVWSTPFTHAKAAAPLLPLLQRYFGLLAQLTIAVRQGRAFEQRASKLLAEKRLNYRKPAVSPKPTWGAIIENDRTARFMAWAEVPVTRSQRRPGSCPKTNGTFRYFQNTDSELVNRIRCVGRPTLAFQDWTYRVILIKLILMEIKKLNPSTLTTRFAKAAE